MRCDALEARVAMMHNQSCEVDVGLCATQLPSRLVAGSFVADDKTRFRRAQVLGNNDGECSIRSVAVDNADDKGGALSRNIGRGKGEESATTERGRDFEASARMSRAGLSLLSDRVLLAEVRDPPRKVGNVIW